jgi:4-hydroxy-tetrahydrodipicolinate synthase
MLVAFEPIVMEPVQLGGVIAVVPTPFLPSGEIDRESLTRVVRLYRDAGVNGLTALGVTSEVAWLTDAEREVVLRTIMEVARDSLPGVDGATAQSADTCIGYASAARSAGASALMIAPPRDTALEPDAVLSHFDRVADAVDLPIVVQDYPEVSGGPIEASILATLVRELEHVSAIKLEDPPTGPKIATVLQQLDGQPFPIFGGLGGVYLFEELLAGSAGAMTGFAFPEVLVEVDRLFASGDRAAAADSFYRHVPLMRFEFQAGIGMAIRKEILRRRGAIAHATTRAPGAGLDPATIAALDQLLAWYRETTRPSWLPA